MANPPLTPVKDFYDQVNRYAQPEELFGSLGATQSQQLLQLETAYRYLIKQYHPDYYANQPAELYYVTEIAKRLNILKHQAEVKIKACAYGDTRPGDYKSVMKTARHEFYVTDLLVEGTEADIYRAYYFDPQEAHQPAKDVVIKIVADPGRNILAEQEAAFYQALSHFCFPRYVESFRANTGQRALVLGYIAEGYDLIELTRRYRQQYSAPGLPQEHLVWILERFLNALGLLHQNRILHGNIQPDNLMVQPRLHNGLLIDFLHCRIDPEPEDVFSIRNPAYCAPEVLTRRFKPHPVSDIYALGCCMIEMLGGTGLRLDDSIILHPLLRQFLHKMTLPDPAKRASDAWTLAEELKSLRLKIFGAKKYIPLEIGG